MFKSENPRHQLSFPVNPSSYTRRGSLLLLLLLMSIRWKAEYWSSWSTHHQLMPWQVSDIPNSVAAPTSIMSITSASIPISRAEPEGQEKKWSLIERRQNCYWFGIKCGLVKVVNIRGLEKGLKSTIETWQSALSVPVIKVWLKCNWLGCN